MDGNKDEAARCLRLAKLALAAGDKPRAVKLLRFARRLDPSLSTGSTDRSFTGDQSTLIHGICSHTDYYAILGVARTSTADDIRRAYRKLSLKVHPDKTSAPGAEDAFKAVSNAFACLSNPDSRRAYDRAGLIEDEVRVRRRRGRAAPDEVYNSFFHEYRTERVPRARQDGPIGLSFVLLLCAAIILIIAVLANVPMEQEYSLRKTHMYGVRRVTNEHGVEYFVKSEEFDRKYPPGSSERDDFEGDVLRSYKSVLWQHCYRETRRRRWGRVSPAPHCDKLRSIQVA